MAVSHYQVQSPQLSLPSLSPPAHYQAPHYLLITKPKAHNSLYQAPHHLLITKPQLGNVNPEAGLPHYCFTKLGLGKEKGTRPFGVLFLLKD